MSGLRLDSGLVADTSFYPRLTEGLLGAMPKRGGLVFVANLNLLRFHHQGLPMKMGLPWTANQSLSNHNAMGLYHFLAG